MSALLLRLDGVSCLRGGRLLFEDLGIELGAGETMLLTGPNGAGKSSLLRLVAGLLNPVAGSIVAAPVALADDRLALDRELTVRAALRFWGEAEAVATAMTAMGIDGLADVPVRYLSTGQARRARLARVLASGALLWLLDEPTNGLDSDGIERLNSAIKRHRDSDGAVLAASHVPLAGEWRSLEIGA